MYGYNAGEFNFDLASHSLTQSFHVCVRDELQRINFASTYCLITNHWLDGWCARNVINTPSVRVGTGKYLIRIATFFYSFVYWFYRRPQELWIILSISLQIYCMQTGDYSPRDWLATGGIKTGPPNTELRFQSSWIRAEKGHPANTTWAARHRNRCDTSSLSIKWGTLWVMINHCVSAQLGTPIPSDGWMGESPLGGHQHYHQHPLRLLCWKGDQAKAIHLDCPPGVI